MLKRVKKRGRKGCTGVRYQLLRGLVMPVVLQTQRHWSPDPQEGGFLAVREGLDVKECGLLMCLGSNVRDVAHRLRADSTCDSCQLLVFLQFHFHFNEEMKNRRDEL